MSAPSGRLTGCPPHMVLGGDRRQRRARRLVPAVEASLINLLIAVAARHDGSCAVPSPRRSYRLHQLTNHLGQLHRAAAIAATVWFDALGASAAALALCDDDGARRVRRSRAVEASPYAVGALAILATWWDAARSCCSWRSSRSWLGVRRVRCEVARRHRPGRHRRAPRTGAPRRVRARESRRLRVACLRGGDLGQRALRTVLPGHPPRGGLDGPAGARSAHPSVRPLAARAWLHVPRPDLRAGARRGNRGGDRPGASVPPRAPLPGSSSACGSGAITERRWETNWSRAYWPAATWTLIDSARGRPDVGAHVEAHANGSRPSSSSATSRCETTSPASADGSTSPATGRPSTHSAAS